MNSAYIAEPLPGDRQAKDTDLATKRGQVRYLREELGVTGAQANALIRAYILDQRDADARRASREEFGAWLNRRGDLIRVRGKARHAWRVAT